MSICHMGSLLILCNPICIIFQNIHARVGSIIHGKVDSYDKDVIFTDAFVTRMRAQIRGAFSAITRSPL